MCGSWLTCRMHLCCSDEVMIKENREANAENLLLSCAPLLGPGVSLSSKAKVHTAECSKMLALS